MKDNVLTGKIIGAAIDVHKALGPGLCNKQYSVILPRKPLVSLR